MTTEEFDKTKFCFGMKAIYKGEEYAVASADFEERLFALDGVTLGADESTWVRCENVTAVSQ